ncbi:MAG: hypothetical protein LBU51_00120 [Bacteroidales bacterium]|jgi:hypothetical protein|nr:hypothetical protein [Bacteroidales bacterium]
MNTIFYKKPEKRKFHYKPRFYEADGGVHNERGEFDPDKFGNRLHNSWQAKRDRNKKNTTSNTRVIILMCIVIILVFIAYKFIFR